MRRPLSFATLVVLAAAGCSQEKPPEAKQVELHGAVQKGPFVIGSAIEVSLLGTDLNPTGQVFNAQTTNDRGEFDLNFAAAGPVRLQGNGYYYNEVAGQLSQSTLTLRAFYVPTSSGSQSAYINLITHLTTERIMALVRAGTAFDAAVTQAEAELLHELNVTWPGYTPAARGIGMNVAGGDSDDNAYLLAVSSVLMQVALDRGGSVEANVQELLNTAANGFAGGTLSDPIKAEISAALLKVDIARIAKDLDARLKKIGSTAAVPDMRRVLDQDRDGLPAISDNCPTVANPGQENRDGDVFGDVCDVCPDTKCDDQCEPKGGNRTVDVCYRACILQKVGCTTPPCDTCGQENCAQVPGLQGPPEQVGVCGVACDPTAADPCPAWLGCFFGMLEQGQGGWTCLPPALRGTLALGSACEMDRSSCGPKMACGTAPEFPFAACRQACDPSKPESCGGKPCLTQKIDSSQVSLCELPAGKLHEPCVGQPQDTCEPTLVCGQGTGCPGPEACCLEAGGLNEPCMRDGSCEASGLVCSFGDVVTGSTPCPSGLRNCCVESGGVGQPCNADGSCDLPTLGCVDDKQMGGRKCQPAGEADQPCKVGQVCNGSNVCVTDGSCGNSPDGYPMWECCKPAGGLDQYCKAGRTCDGSAVCISDGSCKSATGFPMAECCKAAGGPDQFCRADGSCDQGLMCQPPSGVAQCPGGTATCCQPTTACGPGDTCDSGKSCIAGGSVCPAGQSKCCIQVGSSVNAPCTAQGTCNGDGLVCVTPDAGTCLFGATKCCQAAGGKDQACVRGASCKDMGLACVSQPAGGCPYGLDRCCKELPTCSAGCPAGSACSDTLPAVKGAICPGGQPCCVPWGGPLEPCDTAGKCDDGLTCMDGTMDLCLNWGSRCCVQAGASGQPCKSGGVCDDGLSCIQCPGGMGECCYATGGELEPCNPDKTCDLAGLTCVYGSACGTGGSTMNGCCLEAGGLDGPCRNGSSTFFPDGGLPGDTGAALTPCDLGLACVNGPVCAATGGSCCRPAGLAGEPCNPGDTCDAPDLACAQCSNGMGGNCCYEAGAEKQPCLADGSCDPGLACAEGWNQGFCLTDSVHRCCKPAGGQKQPCFADGSCSSGFTCENQAFPGECNDNVYRCCMPAGGQGEPCNVDGSCDAELACMNVGPNICLNAASTRCCVPTLGCADSSECDPGQACLAAPGVCPAGAAKCCLEIGSGIGEPCKADGTCQGSLACVTPPSGTCLYGATECCVAAGALGTPCPDSNPMDSCGSGLSCIEQAPGACPYGLGRCCQPAGKKDQPCTSRSGCEQGLACLPAAEGTCDSVDGFCCGQAVACGAGCEPGLKCVTPAIPGTCPTGNTRCCLPVGGEHEPCDTNRTCASAELFCVDHACMNGANSCCEQWGEVGQACGLNNACDPGLACVWGSPVFTCPNGLNACCMPAGDLDEACYNDSTCNSGFACTWNPSLCNGLDRCCKAAGSLDEPCYNGSTCDAGLACVSNPGLCPSGLNNCCKAAGALDQPCTSTGTCGDGLACVNDWSKCPSGLNNCCVTAGGENQLCTSAGSCNDGLACVTFPPLCAGMTNCCKPAGALDQPCRPGQSCDDGLACTSGPACAAGLTSCCKQAGGPNELCLPGLTCDSGLICVTELGACGTLSNCCLASGAEREPCNSDGSCDAANLACTNVGSWRCASGLSRCCLVAGTGANTPCYTDGTCDGALKCSSTGCMDGLPQCCVP